MEASLNFKILFISHNASRTGAPILLLSFLHWLRSNSDVDFEVILRDGGDLLADFEKLSSVHVFNCPAPPMPRDTFTRKVSRALKTRGKQTLGARTEWEQSFREREHGKLLERLKIGNFTLIYANTVTNGEVIDFLSPLALPVITHAHELEDVIRSFQRYWPITTARTDHFIAASRAVKDNLVQRHAIPADRVSVVHTFVPTVLEENPSANRVSLHLPEHAFLVCGSGMAEWRKGQDLFILLAERVERLFGADRFHFVWVGGWATELDRRRALDLVDRLDLSGKITFTGHVNNPLAYFAASDVFAMVSREDPFPLVCLEAAAQGVPILCFDKAGGMPEFVEEDGGFVVPFCDIQEMAQKIGLLSSNPRLAEELGKRARQKVHERYQLDVGCNGLMKVIEQVAHSWRNGGVQ